MSALTQAQRDALSLAAGYMLGVGFTDTARELRGMLDAPGVPQCSHPNTRNCYDHLLCTDCFSIRTDSQWGPLASNRWFKSYAEAKGER